MDKSQSQNIQQPKTIEQSQNSVQNQQNQNTLNQNSSTNQNSQQNTQNRAQSPQNLDQEFIKFQSTLKKQYENIEDKLLSTKEEYKTIKMILEKQVQQQSDIIDFLKFQQNLKNPDIISPVSQPQSSKFEFQANKQDFQHFQQIQQITQPQQVEKTPI